jgi:hypothetical protein
LCSKDEARRCWNLPQRLRVSSITTWAITILVLND